MRTHLENIYERLRISGPLPGRPAERGEFVMNISSYGHPPGWWITVDAQHPAD